MDFFKVTQFDTSTGGFNFFKVAGFRGSIFFILIGLYSYIVETIKNKTLVTAFISLVLDYFFIWLFLCL